MRIRGRRIALLLASALPLLADEGTIPETTTSNQQQSDEDENDFVPLTAVEAIHHDGFKLPALQNVDILIPEQHAAGALVHKNGHWNSKVSEIDAEEEEAETDIDDLEGRIEHMSTESGTDNAEPPGATQEEPVGQTNRETPTPDNIAIDEASPQNTTAVDSETLPPYDGEQVKPADNETLSEEVDETSEGTSDDAADDDEETLRNRVSVDYASKSAGALIIEKSKSFRGTSNLLNSDRDKYAIAPCEDKKFVVISLSEDILVKTIRIANYERFSSTVEDFQILGSQTLGTWVDLGTYSAAPGNGEQVFDLIEPTWARYLRFKFLSHHGVEYYCTCSQIQVHGSTMTQGFHDHWEEEETDTDAALDESVDTPGVDDATNVGDGDTLDDQATHGQAQAIRDPSDEARGQQASENGVKDTRQADDTINSEFGEELSSGSTEQQFFSPVAVGQFCSSADLDAMLHGRIEDGALLNELFDLIPSTLMALPSMSRSRESPGRKTSSDHDLTSLEQLGPLALTSIFSSSKLADTTSEAYSSGTIKVPQMSDTVEEILSRGRDLALRIGFHAARATNEAAKDPLKTTDNTSQVESNEDPEGTQSDSEARKGNGDDDDFVAQPPHGTTDKEPEAENESVTIPATDRAVINATSLPNSTVEGKHDQFSSNETTYEPMGEDGLALSALLTDLPSADCLRTLNFTEMKAKAMAARKSSSGSGSSQSNAAMEPIFKKLTDEIRSLQTSLSVHDQYARMSTACYQRVLFDLIVEAERKQNVQDLRMSRLEEDFKKSQSFFLIRIFRWVVHATSSFVVYSCSGFYSLVSATMRYWVDVAHDSYPFMLSLWPSIKASLLSWKAGAVLVDRLSPFIQRLDDLLDNLGGNETTQETIRIQETADVGWTFPMVPAVITLVLCRILMCCTTTYNKRVLRKSKFQGPKAQIPGPLKEHQVPDLIFQKN